MSSELRTKFYQCSHPSYSAKTMVACHSDGSPEFPSTVQRTPDLVVNVRVLKASNVGNARILTPSRRLAPRNSPATYTHKPHIEGHNQSRLPIMVVTTNSWWLAPRRSEGHTQRLSHSGRRAQQHFGFQGRRNRWPV